MLRLEGSTNQHNTLNTHETKLAADLNLSILDCFEKITEYLEIMSNIKNYLSVSKKASNELRNKTRKSQRIMLDDLYAIFIYNPQSIDKFLPQASSKAKCVKSEKLKKLHANQDTYQKMFTKIRNSELRLPNAQIDPKNGHK